MALETPKGASFTIWNPGRDLERNRQSKIKDEGRWRERHREDEWRGDLVTAALLNGFVTHTN